MANQVTSFIKQIVATIQGDNAEATAQKVYRAADSAFKSQIPSLDGDTIAKEDAVLEAKEALDKARINNGKEITDRNAYIANLFDKKNTLIIAEANLENHLNKIAFLKEQHSLINE